MSEPLEETAKKKPRKRDRFIRVCAVFSCGTHLVEVEERGPKSSETSTYEVRQIPSDLGRAWQWKKIGVVNVPYKEGRREKSLDTHHLRFDGDFWSCDCTCGLRQGDTGIVCRHVAGTLKLLSQGRFQ